MLASVKSQCWLIQPDAIQDFALASLEAAEKSDSERSEGYWEDFYTLRQSAFIDADKIAHIEVRGALMDKSPAIYEKLGLATRYTTVVSETEAATSKGAIGIIYHVDSPGGTVAGVIEAGSAIMSAGVPTVAHCSGLSCSAAYWLSSGATKIMATPSAQVGNIGAIISWADCDEFWANMGVTFKTLTSEGADLKSTFHTEPDEAQLAFLQESIDEAGAAFREHVKAGRERSGAELNDEVWRAGWYSGQKAWGLGLVDAIGSTDDARNAILELIAS